MFGKKAFPDKQAEGAVAAQIIECRKRKVAIPAIVEQCFFTAAKPFQHAAHFAESFCKNKETKVRGVELGVDNSKDDRVNIFQDAEDFDPPEVG